MNRFSKILLGIILSLSLIAGAMMVNEHPESFPASAQTAAAFSDDGNVLAEKPATKTPKAKATEVDHGTGGGDDSASDGNPSDSDSVNNDDDHSNGPNGDAPNDTAANKANCDNNGFDCTTAVPAATKTPKPKATNTLKVPVSTATAKPTQVVYTATAKPTNTLRPTNTSQPTNTPGTSRTPGVTPTNTSQPNTPASPTNTPVNTPTNTGLPGYTPTSVTASQAEDATPIVGTCEDKELFWDVVVPGKNGLNDMVVRWDVIRKDGKVAGFANRFVYDLSKAGPTVTISDISHEPTACGRVSLIINGSLWIVNRDGTDLHLVTSGEFPITAQAVSWGPESMAIVESDSMEVWTLQPDGSEMKNLNAQAVNLDFSKDGQMITLETADGTQAYIRPDGQDLKLTGDELVNPRWDPEQELTCGDSEGVYVCTDHVVELRLAVWARDGVLDPSGTTTAAVLESTFGLFLVDNVWASPADRSTELVADIGGTLPEWYVPERLDPEAINLVIPATATATDIVPTNTAVPTWTPASSGNGSNFPVDYDMAVLGAGILLLGLGIFVWGLYFALNKRQPVATEEKQVTVDADDFPSL